MTAGHAAEVCLKDSQALDIEAIFLILVSLILGNSSRFAYLSVETQSLFCHPRYLAHSKDDSMAHRTYMPIQPWVTVEKMTNMFVVYRPSTSWKSERTLCKPLSMTLFKMICSVESFLEMVALTTLYTELLLKVTHFVHVQCHTVCVWYLCLKEISPLSNKVGHPREAFHEYMSGTSLQ